MSQNINEELEISEEDEATEELRRELAEENYYDTLETKEEIGEAMIKDYPPVIDKYLEKGLLTKEEYLRIKKYGFR